MSAADIVVTRWGVRAFGRRLPAAIGKGGITHAKREGDGGTPAGIHRIEGMLYRPDRIARPAPWAEPILPGDLWSDASGQPDYNHAVRAPYPFSHEKLRRADPLYDAVLVTDWNWPEAEAGRGSAIFLHQWRRPRFPTEGCVAFGRDDLMWLLSRITPGTRLIVKG
ncbi:L,D-transpeptidase family protein [Mangrovicoccus ximenensis]|uniref:L,D-transpeptidase family protein n=1 Tax=Mangrovicoccus ximenensis TaxID=1911570 RepID=UPI000D36D037|nr:L,D-transpeptidase family protein [Mangrovicoccus ximenensis]